MTIHNGPFNIDPGLFSSPTSQSADFFFFESQMEAWIWRIMTPLISCNSNILNLHFKISDALSRKL